jgi:glycosyltransferase involved in cell wall biosynthesis
MACRVPVVGSDSGEIPKVIGDAGLIFPEGDVGALRERLASLMDRPELATRLAELGYARAMERYTNRVTARQQLDFYREVLRRPSRARRVSAPRGSRNETTTAMSSGAVPVASA